MMEVGETSRPQGTVTKSQRAAEYKETGDGKWMIQLKHKTRNDINVVRITIIITSFHYYQYK